MWIVGEYIDWTSWSPLFITTVEIDSSPLYTYFFRFDKSPDVMEKIVEKVYNILRGDVRVFIIVWSGYESTSGAEKIVFSFKPVLTIGKTDIYAFRTIYFTSWYKEKFFQSIRSIVDYTITHYKEDIAHMMKKIKPRKIRYIAWSSIQGYHTIYLVEPADIVPTILFKHELQEILTILKITEDLELTLEALKEVFKERTQQ